MSRKIEIPFRDRDESLVDVACSTRSLEDGRVMQTIIVDAALVDGMKTAGELIDALDAMSQAERRELLNRARVENGMDTVEDEIAHHRFEATNRALRPRPIPRCPICGIQPLTSAGFPDPQAAAGVKVWHCEQHRHLAKAGDLDPPPSGIGLDMRPIPDPDEIARIHHEDELRERANAQRREQRDYEAAGRAAAEEARGAQWQPSGPGWWTS